MRNVHSDNQEHPLLLRSLQLVLGLLFFALLHQHYLAKEQEANAQLRYQLTTLSQGLEDAISSNRHILHTLTSHVQTEPELTQKRFEQIALDIFSRKSGIRSLQLAKNSTISHLSPRAGNQAALGLNLLEYNQTSERTQEAIDHRDATLAGPLELIQGGTGIALRMPVYLRATPEQAERYWGLAIVLLDWGQVLRESGLTSLLSEYDIALRQQRPDGQWSEAFYGDSTLFMASDAEQMTLHLPNTLWQIATRSKLGSNSLMALLGVALGLLLAEGAIYYLLKLSISHHQQAPTALLLCFILFAALLTGFDTLQQRSAQRVMLTLHLSDQYHNTRTRLLTLQQQLHTFAILQSQQALTKATFQQYANQQQLAFPELDNMFWVDERRLLKHASNDLSTLVVNQKISSKQSQQAGQLAQKQRQPAFSAPFEKTPEKFVFDLWHPIYQGPQMIGLVGARIDCQQLLEQSLLPGLLNNYRLQLRGYGKIQYAQVQLGTQPLSEEKKLISLVPPGHGMALELTRLQTSWPLLNRLLLGLLLGLGAFAAFSRHYLLRRYRMLKQEHAQQLEHNHLLSNEHDLLTITLHAIGEGVITTDENRLITRINPEAERLCLCQAADVLGQTLFSTLHLQAGAHSKPLREQLQQALEQVQQTLSIQRLNGILVDENTELHNVRCTIAPILNDQQAHLGNIIIIHDLSSIQATARRLDYRDSQEQYVPLDANEFELCCKEALIHSRETHYSHLLLYIDWEPSSSHEPNLPIKALEKSLFELIKHQIRVQDPVARLGERRFALLLRYCPEKEGTQLARKILHAVQQPNALKTEDTQSVRLAIGLAVINCACKDYQSLTAQADIACYIAHTSGPNRYFQNPEGENETHLTEERPQKNGTTIKPPQN